MVRLEKFQALYYYIFVLQDIHCAPKAENQCRNLWGEDIRIAGF